MTISTDVLERFAPRPYAEVRDLVRNGDIMLCQGSDAFSKLIRWSTKSPWSHIAMAFRIERLDRVVVIEAVEKIGVRCVALSEFVSRDSEGVSPYPGKILLARHSELSQDADNPGLGAVAKFAFDHLGCKFASGEIAKIALRIATARLLGDRRTPKFLLRDDEFICSEFVAKAYEEAGLQIPWDGLGFIAPADFAKDPKLSAIAQVDVSHPPHGPRRGQPASSA
jgi:hypothetical protein